MSTGITCAARRRAARTCAAKKLERRSARDYADFCKRERERGESAYRRRSNTRALVMKYAARVETSDNAEAQEHIARALGAIDYACAAAREWSRAHHGEAAIAARYWVAHARLALAGRSAPERSRDEEYRRFLRRKAMLS